MYCSNGMLLEYTVQWLKAAIAKVHVRSCIAPTTRLEFLLVALPVLIYKRVSRYLNLGSTDFAYVNSAVPGAGVQLNTWPSGALRTGRITHLSLTRQEIPLPVWIAQWIPVNCGLLVVPVHPTHIVVEPCYSVLLRVIVAVWAKVLLCPSRGENVRWMYSQSQANVQYCTSMYKG